MRQVHDALAAPAVRTEDAPATVPDSADAGDHDGTFRLVNPRPPPLTPSPLPRWSPLLLSLPRAAQGARAAGPGAGKTARAVRSDDELLADLRELRTGADRPLSQRAVLAALGIGVPRLRALLDAHGRILDPLPLPAPRLLYPAPDTTEPVAVDDGGVLAATR